MYTKTLFVFAAVLAVASAAPKPGVAVAAPLAYTAAAAPIAYTAAGPVAYTAPLAYSAPLAYAAAPVATSSQVIARNYNGIATAPYFAAPAAAYVF